ncbi:MAG: PucR family transcriptional regulator [Gordonia sp. (in: high G+C Gram-positive bacteria)]
MLIGTLLDRPEFGLRLLVDPGGARKVQVDRVFGTDQPLPERYLSGGELVLTGLIFHSGTPEESEAFVASAAQGGAQAIGAGVDHFGGEVPEHFVDACRAHRIPLFSVPAEVSFADITQSFIERGAARADRLGAALAQSRRLLSSLAEGRELDDLASIVVGVTGIGCQILTASGRRVCAVRCRLPEDDVDALLDVAQAARHFPAAAHGRTVFPVGRARDPMTAWFLVLETPPASLTTTAMDAFSEFAAVAALVRARNTDSTSLRERHDDLAVAEMLVADTGPDRGGALVVRCADPRRIRPVVYEALSTVSGDVVAAVVSTDGGDDEVIAYVPARSAPAAETVAGHLRRMLRWIDGPVQIGHADVSGASFGGAIRGARHAASLGDGPLSVTSAESLGTAASLFAHLGDDVRRDFVERVLGPLEAYDADTDAGLVDTLEQFLAHDCSWVRTAEATHMHTNTVRYRIGRAEQITGRSLSNMSDRMDLLLALELR